MSIYLYAVLSLSPPPPVFLSHSPSLSLALCYQNIDDIFRHISAMYDVSNAIYIVHVLLDYDGSQSVDRSVYVLSVYWHYSTAYVKCNKVLNSILCSMLILLYTVSKNSLYVYVHVPTVKD